MQPSGSIPDAALAAGQRESRYHFRDAAQTHTSLHMWLLCRTTRTSCFFFCTNLRCRFTAQYSWQRRESANALSGFIGMVGYPKQNHKWCRQGAAEEHVGAASSGGQGGNVQSAGSGSFAAPRAGDIHRVAARSPAR